MLYRFHIELSDIDRGVYETLDLRLAQHPSETGIYLLTRLLAYCLSYEEGLEFSPTGLSDPDEPAIRKLGQHNNTEMWIEVGNPGARKLHKASKQAKRVSVFTYKNPEVLLIELRQNDIHQKEKFLIYSLQPSFLEKLETKIEKNNKMSILIQQSQIDVNILNESMSTEVKQHFLNN